MASAKLRCAAQKTHKDAGVDTRRRRRREGMARRRQGQEIVRNDVGGTLLRGHGARTPHPRGQVRYLLIGQGAAPSSGLRGDRLP